MKFSLLCPTRGRIAGVRRLLESIRRTTGSPENIEILFKVDKDDLSTIELFEKIKSESWPFLIRSFIGFRSPYLQEDYYNFLAFEATGEYIWAVGDDTEVISSNWDIILKNEIAQFRINNSQISDEILYISIEDTTPAPSIESPAFCCFPIVSKKSIEILGFLFHPDIMTWGADCVLYSVYSSPHFFRVLTVNAVILKHYSHHNQLTLQDNLNKDVEMRYRINAFFVNFLQKYEVPKNIQQLRIGLPKMHSIKMPVFDKILNANRIFTKGAYQISYKEYSEGRRQIMLSMSKSCIFWISGGIFLLLSFLPHAVYQFIFYLFQIGLIGLIRVLLSFLSFLQKPLKYFKGLIN